MVQPVRRQSRRPFEAPHSRTRWGKLILVTESETNRIFLKYLLYVPNEYPLDLMFVNNTYQVTGFKQW